MASRIAEILLWGSLGLIIYSYFLYPLIVYALASIKKRTLRIPKGFREPAVSVVVSFYNEEASLPEKLQSLKRHSFPAEKIEFLFGSDGSTDRTNELLRSVDDPRIRFFEFPNRRGKAAVLNDLVASAKHDIVLFTDANTVFEEDTILEMVRHFGDHEVGGVCGKLVLLPEGGDPGSVSEESYWSYENWLKRLESEYHTLLGATGGVYAIRRDLFVPLPLDKPVTDDFVIPIQVVKNGFRVVYASNAKAYEQTSGSMRGEFKRKARIGAQNFGSIQEFSSLLLPSAGFVAFALWSHKIIRWFVPHLATVAFLATLWLSFGSTFYACFLGFQIGFILVALLGLIADRKRIPIGPLSLPYYVVAMNCALFLGFFRFLAGKERPTWDVVR